MAVHPVHAAHAAALRRFDPSHAALVASWVRDEREAEWLAPRTPPPLTGRKVLHWAGPGRQPLELVDLERDCPVAYGELNILQNRRLEYWLGHLIVDGEQRGQGWGTRLVQALLERAFEWHAARCVSLVVFPENTAAISAYHAAGMKPTGHETHYFAPYDRKVQLLRMERRRT